jgi:DNA-binding NarL/FixJ family response regulator
MQDSAFQILFLGENIAWSRISQALFNAPDDLLHVQRLDSLADLFHSLAVGRWHALAIDVHAWNFQGLHYVEKVRSEYPAFPIIAIHSGAVPDLERKALISGASRCVALNSLTSDSLHSAVASTLANTKSQFILQKGAQMELPLSPSQDVCMTFSKNQVITHALNNLLCVIAANADILSDKLNSASGPGLPPDPRPLSEIKKAAKSAAALMRHLK